MLFFWKASAEGIVQLCRVHNRKLHEAYVDGIPADNDISGQNSATEKESLCIKITN